jgi:GNAT superfamily N-acetyltransferase
VQHMLFRGKFMYVDDLVTDDAVRSHGYGEQMFAWLKEVARTEGCRMLDLDSGVQRMAAHRFYFRQRMTIASYHFSLPLDNPVDSGGEKR